MGARFIIGRAGTGKTTRCAREIAAELAQKPLGPPLFWITSDQATFTAERLLLTGPNSVRGAFRAQILSFRRLTLLLARDLGILNAEAQLQTPLEEIARLVLLEEMLTHHRSQLQLFAAVADRPGFIRKLDATLRELRQHGHTGDSLRALAHPAADARKFADLALLLDAWCKIVDADNIWDWERIMTNIAVRIDQSPVITAEGGAQIWVDGISAMTTLEMRLLAGLALHAQRVTITLLADPDSPALRDLRRQSEDSLFARTERLHRRLIDTFRKSAVQIEPQVTLHQSHRFTTPALLSIESQLWNPNPKPQNPIPDPTPTNHESPATKHEPLKSAKSRKTPAAMPLFDLLGTEPSVAPNFMPPQPPATSAVEIWQASDPETEVRIIAQTIRHMVVGDTPVRYRQIGIIAPDLEGYADAVRRIFREHQIPHFVDARRTMAHHPILELVRSIVAIAVGRGTPGRTGESAWGMWDRDDILLYLKTGLAGIAASDVSLVENYTIAHGISRIQWNDKWTWLQQNISEEEAGARTPASAAAILARVNEIRAKVWSDLEPWTTQNDLRRASGVKTDAAEFVRDLKTLLQNLAVESQITQWADTAKRQTNLELAQTHEQAWREVQTLLAMLETILTGKPRSLDEFESLLSTALENLTLGLIPPTVDQVLVSSVMRSRTPELDVVFILGAIEGQLPKVIDEDPILTDAQRDLINDRSPDSIGEGAARQLLEMPFFDYVAFTRAGRRLIITYPLTSHDGRITGPSRYLARVRELLAIDEQKFDAAIRTDPERIATRKDLLSGVVAWAAAQTRGRPEPSPAMESLYNWILADDTLTAARTLAWKAVIPQPDPQLSDRMARLFYPPDQPLHMSVSQLETFGACPLQYFFKYSLGLTPREEFQLDTLELGLLYHRVLEQLYLRIIRDEIDWPSNPDHLRNALDSEVDNSIAELHRELAARTPGYEKTRARAKRQLGRAVEADRRRKFVSSVRPAGVEVFFERGERNEGSRIISLPILRLQTPARRIVDLRGKVDRIDVSEGGGDETAIIDYKSTERRINLNEVLLGFSLQLPLYAILLEKTRRTPCAALFMPLTARRKPVEHAGDAPDPADNKFFTVFKPRGMINADLAGHLDGRIGAGRSEWYAANLNQDGSISKRESDLLTGEDFSLLLRFVQWKIGLMADHLVEGQIAPHPFRRGTFSPCQYCEFAALCPFDQVNGSYREVPKHNSVEAVQAMRREMSID